MISCTLIIYTRVLSTEITLTCYGRRARLSLRATARPPARKIGSDQPTLEDIYRLFEEIFERQLKGVECHLDKMDVLAPEMRGARQRLASLEQDARQPRLAIEADRLSDTKTRERTEGATKAVQAMHGNSFSANRVDPDPMCSTSFGVKAEPPVLPCRDVVLVENGAAAPKSCL